MTKTVDCRISLAIVCISVFICLCAISMPYRRSHSTRLATQLVQKRQEDEFWLNADKSLSWYTMPDDLSLGSEIKEKFCSLNEDEETKSFIEASIVQSESWLIQSWYNLAKTVMSWFSYTHTDMNGILQRGSMFVLSTRQFQALLEHAGADIKDDASMIDLGAGDGKVTAKMAPFFQEIFATETSKPMQRLLRSQHVKVLSIDTWMNQSYDFIACLNLLDRCDKPLDMIRDMKKALKPKGLLLAALVLPFKPFVEAKENYEPSQKLNITSDQTVGQQVQSIVKIFQEFQFELLSWTRVPYLCEGDMIHSVYYLDDILFLFQI